MYIRNTKIIIIYNMNITFIFTFYNYIFQQNTLYMTMDKTSSAFNLKQ